MAKRKVEESGGGEASWLNTFADLMNLLLCFFVLLFAMSTVDAEKWEQLINSMQKSSFSILSSGGASVGEGMMISTGVSQLEMLDDYFKEETNSSDEEETEPKDKETEPTAEEELKEEYEAAGLKESEEMAEQIEEMLAKRQIDNQAEVDVNAQFVRITLSGALLFDSAQSQIREDALPLVDKLSMILANYNSNQIEIEGHTDNVPISNAKYENNDVLSAYRAFAVKDYVLEHTALEAGKIYAAGCGEYNPVADNSTPEGRARNRRVEIKIYNSYNSN
ncbi:MAG: flagellar motor protein MotB [Lachnospiraceae bacterium]|mgnify:CR=1 FL=1|nr:flagellar motor protein MotB [Lachnospiraceae bacterium]